MRPSKQSAAQTLDEILSYINKSADSNADGLRSVAETAFVAKEFGGDEEQRKIIKWTFKEKHGRELAIWSRIIPRFGNEPEYKSGNANTIIALAYLCQLSAEKCDKYFAEVRDHITDGDQEILPFVRELVETHKARQGCGESLKISADVKFDQKGNAIIAQPAEKISWDRGNGKYVVRLRKKKEKK